MELQRFITTPRGRVKKSKSRDSRSRAGPTGLLQDTLGRIADLIGLIQSNPLGGILGPAPPQERTLEGESGVSKAIFANQQTERIGEGSFNPVKFGVGVVNIARGGLSILRGAEKGEDPDDLNLPKRLLQFARGLSAFRRGLRQTREALDDPNGPSARNVLGLLPFGQLFDDPVEPTPFELGAERLRMLRQDLPGTANRILREYFVLEGSDGEQP